MTADPQPPRLPYIALRPEMLDSIREIASDAQLGLAVRLVNYCVTHGYSGRIPAARDWTARQWTFLVGVDTPPATDVAKLWHWEADALVADLYDHHYAEKVQARTAQNRAAAYARWNAPASNTTCERITPPHADAPVYNNNKLNNNTVHLSRNIEREGLNNAELSYQEWKAIMKKCHPSCAKVSTSYFAGDVENAALEAYHQYPDAPQYAQLLTAYYTNTKIKERKNGIAFYRPTAQRAFFLHMGDIITHAQDWAKETKWKPTQTKNTTEHDTKPTQTNHTSTPEDTAEFTSWLSSDVDAHSAAKPTVPPPASPTKPSIDNP